MKVIGIDIGKYGAIAVIDSTDGKVIELLDMPVAKKSIDKYELLNILRKYKPEPHYVIAEKCGYTPAIKGSGAFNFGRNVASVEMALAALEMKHSYIRPQKWKQAFELIGKDKKCSVMKAKEIFPDMIKQLLISKDGRAEALLLAEYCRRNIVGGIPF